MGIALDLINKLRVVEFDWRDKNEHEIGLIAEEVAKVIPEAVGYKDGKIEGLKPLVLIAIIIKALQEREEENAKL